MDDNLYDELLNVIAELVPVKATFHERPRQEERILVRLIRYFVRRASSKDLDQLKKHGIHVVDIVNGCICLYFWCRTREAVQCLMEWIDSGQLAATIEKLINLATAGEENLCQLSTHQEENQTR